MKIAVAGATGAVGRHVVDVVREHGHEAVLLSRAEGVDLVSGAGLDLSGVDAVIDVASTSTQSREESRAFFGAVTRTLQAAELAAGVRHHVSLGIVGSSDAPYAYYAGKALQEQLVEGGEVPWTILRATQFHEFASQIHGSITAGPFILVPKMVSQPVAAREVAERLVQLAEGAPRDACPTSRGRASSTCRAWCARGRGTRERAGPSSPCPPPAPSARPCATARCCRSPVPTSARRPTTNGSRASRAESGRRPDPNGSTTGHAGELP